MFSSIVSIIENALKAIPILDRYLRKSPFEKEKEERAKVDQEHEENEKKGKPSSDFWKGRGV